MVRAYRNFLKNCVNFKGKASRADYWWVFFIHTIFLILLTILFVVVYNSHLKQTDYQDNFEGFWNIFVDIGSYLFIFILVLAVFSLISLIPLLSLQIRRFNDLGWKWQVSLAVFLGLSLLNILTLGKSGLLVYLLNILPTNIFKRNLTGS